MAAPVIISAEEIIAGGRKTYRTIPPDDTYAQSIVLKVVASMLNLEDPDYEDLVRHLVTADEVDTDAFRWATVIP